MKRTKLSKRLLAKAREDVNAGRLLYDFENGGFIQWKQASKEIRDKNNEIEENAQKAAQIGDLEYLKK